MTGVKETQDSYMSSFAELEKSLAGGGPFSLAPVRRAAIGRFAEMGFPQTSMEEWKYTSVAPIAGTRFAPAPRAELSEEMRDRIAGSATEENRLAFVNGHYCPELSSIEPALRGSVRICSLAEAMGESRAAAETNLARLASYESNAFVALNTAFMADGAFIEVSGGTVVDKPIHVLFLSTAGGEPTISHPRNLIVAGRESQVRIVEDYVGLGEAVYFTNAVTEIVAGENAIIDYYRAQQESEASYHVSTVQVRQERSSNFTSHSISVGGGLVRNDLNSVLDGQGAECLLNGLYMTRGRQHVDNHTRVDHAKPHCTSRELYKGILDGKTTAVFNGAVVVHKDAQKTDARQSNKNLLLSEDATVNTKPQLEIYADDVKCTHGATIGQLDTEAIFYLRSRGISEGEAFEMLTGAFAAEVLDSMKSVSVRDRIGEILSSRLNAGEGT